MPRISAARVLLLLVASSVFRISIFSASSTVVPTPRRTASGSLAAVRSGACPKAGGKCLVSITPASQTMTARSMVLRNSRTLPGHEYWLNWFSTASLTAATLRECLLLISPSNSCTRLEMSSLCSRRGGMWMLTSLVQAETRKIVVLGMPPEHIAELQSVSPEARIVPADEASLLGEAADADAIFGASSPELLHAARKLKWVQVYSAGVENYLFPEFQSSGVVLTNCKILMGPEIADHAFALLLSLTRELNRIIPTRASEEWRRDGFHPIEL